MSKGAQQPGMTGQVKEDILTRMAELGVQTHSGKLVFKPYMLHKNEFVQDSVQTRFVLVDGSIKTLDIKKNSLAFTVCQVPVIYIISEINKIEVLYANGHTNMLNTLELTKEISNEIFQRKNTLSEIKVFLTQDNLR